MAPENDAQAIVMTLLEQRKNRVERGFYWESQIAIVYNSEKMEGNLLSEDQTRAIFETGTVTGKAVPVQNVIETTNHFKMFDLMLDTLDEPLSKDLLKAFHGQLKSGLDDSGTPGGEWKRYENFIGGMSTTRPKDVDKEIGRLINAYSNGRQKDIQQIASFHWLFERIHPFQDGNGRVGRMTMFRECIVNDIMPFIVLDETKLDYYKGLQYFESNPELLVSYFARMQDRYVDAFASLLPENRLLPRLREAAERTEAAEFEFERYFDGISNSTETPSPETALRNANAIANRQSAARQSRTRTESR